MYTLFVPSCEATLIFQLDLVQSGLDCTRNDTSGTQVYTSYILTQGQCKMTHLHIKRQHVDHNVAEQSPALHQHNNNVYTMHTNGHTKQIH